MSRLTDSQILETLAKAQKADQILRVNAGLDFSSASPAAVFCVNIATIADEHVVLKVIRSNEDDPGELRIVIQDIQHLEQEGDYLCLTAFNTPAYPCEHFTN